MVLILTHSYNLDLARLTSPAVKALENLNSALNNKIACLKLQIKYVHISDFSPHLQLSTLGGYTFCEALCPPWVA